MKPRDSLKIAFLLPYIEIGGFWLTFARELRRLVPGAVIFTGQLWRDFDARLEGAAAFRRVGRMRSITLRRTTGYEHRVMVLSPSIVWHLARFRPDVVIVQAFSMWSVVAALMKPLFRWRLVLVMEGSTPNVDHVRSRSRNIARRFIARRCDSFVSNALTGVRYLIGILGVPAAKVRHSHYMLADPNNLFTDAGGSPHPKVPSDRTNFLYVGRLDPRKGIDRLIEEAASLRDREDWHLWIVGSGPQQPQLEERVRFLGLDSRVTFAGWVRYGELGPWFESTDVFVFPTVEDTWGMVVAEAMALGMAVISSGDAGVAELVTASGCGFVVDAAARDAYVNAMRAFLEGSADAAVMGDRAAEYIRRELEPSAAVARFLDAALET